MTIPGKTRLAQPLEELLIPANVAAVQKRNIEFDVAAVKFPAFGKSACGGADAKMQIPEGLAQRSDDFPAQEFLAAFLLIQEQADRYPNTETARAGRIRPWPRCRIPRRDPPPHVTSFHNSLTTESINEERSRMAAFPSPESSNCFRIRADSSAYRSCSVEVRLSASFQPGQILG